MAWDVFICHATEDKEFVRPLAAELKKAGLRVWYDEFEMRLGASIRRSIDRGLRDSQFGVVVLSRAFFSKRWPQVELDGLVTLESKGKSLILPIWHDIGLDEVAEHSPALADRLAAQSSDQIEEIVDNILEIVRQHQRPYLEAERGKFPHFMIKEIYDQPRILEDRLVRWNRGRSSTRSLGKLIAGTQSVTLVGAGASFYAAELGALWFRKLAQQHAEAVPASELLCRDLDLLGEIVVFVSHSGATPEVLKLAVLAKAQGSKLVAICGTPRSELVALCDFTWHTDVGPELSVPATKSLTGQLLCLLELAATIRESPSREFVDLANQVALLPNLVRAALEMESEIHRLANQLSRIEPLLITARGELLPIAQGAALRIKKAAMLSCTAYAEGEFQHGPITLVDEDMPVVVLATDGIAGSKTVRTMRQIISRGGVVCPVLFHSSPLDSLPLAFEELEVGLQLDVSGFSPLLAPFGAEVVLQLLAYHLGTARGFDVDLPRYLLGVALRKRGGEQGAAQGPGALVAP